MTLELHEIRIVLSFRQTSQLHWWAWAVEFKEQWQRWNDFYFTKDLCWEVENKLSNLGRIFLGEAGIWWCERPYQQYWILGPGAFEKAP